MLCIKFKLLSIKIQNLKIWFIASLLILVSNCAGTGSKNISTISIDEKIDKVGIYFSRPSAYYGGAVLGSITVNGEKVGNIGDGEYIRHIVNPGSFSAKIETGGLALGAISADSVAGTGKNGDKFFYIISIKPGFLSSDWKLTETTNLGFKQSQK